MKRRKSCPNKVRLRTSLDEKIEKLSEQDVTSDKFGGKEGKVVRTGCDFRQVWRKRLRHDKISTAL